MNGLLADEDYTDILAFFDIYSATLLGIESLTLISRPPVIVQTSADSNITNENKPKAATKGISSPSGNIPGKGQKSDKVAEKVLEIINNYNKTKTELFILLEFKKLHNSGVFPTKEYIELLKGLAASGK